MYPSFSVKSFGAAGDGSSLDTSAIQSTIDACYQTGGGTVFFPAGRYVTGSLLLHDNITLYIDSGAVLVGSMNPPDYPPLSARWEGVEQQTHAPLIGGGNLHNISIVGRGIIDGRGGPWWEMYRAKTLDCPRPRLIAFADCTNVLIEGVTLTNSPAWTINPVRCENVTVDKVTITNPADSPNTDGINPDSCRSVHISNCQIDVGDDCVTLKSGIETESPDRRSPCENITITNCTMLHGHGGVVIGSEMSGDVRNVVISNCIFIGTDRGLRIKSRRGRGGIVEDIRASNIIMRGVLCPFTMNLYYHFGVKGNKIVADKSPRPVDSGTPLFRNIHFAHITARDAQYAAAFLYGLPEMPIQHVSFSDVSISMATDAQSGAPDMADDIEPMCRGGLFARNVRGLRLDRVDITNQIGDPFLLQDIS